MKHNQLLSGECSNTKWCIKMPVVVLHGHIEVSPEWRRTFIGFSELSEFRESDKSLMHELGSI